MYELKALANEVTLLRIHCCRYKCFPVCPRSRHLLRTQILCPGHKKCFWFCTETFCVRNKCFPVCAAQETSWATMCPQQCVLVYQGLNRVRRPYWQIFLVASYYGNWDKVQHSTEWTFFYQSSNITAVTWLESERELAFTFNQKVNPSPRSHHWTTGWKLQNNLPTAVYFLFLLKSKRAYEFEWGARQRTPAPLFAFAVVQFPAVFYSLFQLSCAEVSRSTEVIVKP